MSDQKGVPCFAKTQKQAESIPILKLKSCAFKVVRCLFKVLNSDDSLLTYNSQSTTF